MSAALRAHLPLVALALAVIAGAAAMHRAGGPAHYAPLNLAALVAGVGLYALARSKGSPAPLLWLAPVALLATALFGFEIEGVRRWIGVPPVTLHAGMLVLPMFLGALALRPDRPAIGASALVALALALQPDRGTAFAFLLATAVLALGSRRPAAWWTAALAALGFAATMAQPDSLAPAAHVEGVVRAMASEGGALAFACLLLLAGAVVVPVPRGPGGWALAAWLAGLVAASLAGAYPTPLLGYGAAPVLGYGLALGFMGQAGRWPIRD